MRRDAGMELKDAAPTFFANAAMEMAGPYLIIADETDTARFRPVGNCH
jgi:hypothetical protein